jgi:hypothetical protein
MEKKKQKKRFDFKTKCKGQNNEVLITVKK